ncbi:nucleotide-sugar transporter-domain-containing protein [Parasitella parasitica]|nr:nucleotide-sugar transporter-domain-containing protein [Parasitella parasitica]
MMSSYYPSRRSFRKKHELPLSNRSHAVGATEPLFFGLNPKQLSLIILVVQNSMLVLLMRYSRTPTQPDQPLYIASTAVFMAELIKIVACLYMLHVEGNSYRRCIHLLYLEIFHRPREIAKMLVPSGLYALQNNLLYIALGNLEAATFQVTYQLKILSTAAFSVWLLGRSLNRENWLALVLLMIGVTLVQAESVSSSQTTCSNIDGNSQRPLVGLLAVLTSCVSSGFAGCYFEKILKTSSTSMWIRNIQLGLCGASFSFIGMIASDFSSIRKQGMFQGYNALTWFVVINQALGGLLVSLVVKYADNILKGFATSISIILSGIISFYLLDFQPSILFITGTGIVISATVLYGLNNEPS